MATEVQVWGRENIDPNAVLQAERTARLPFVQKLALMPDAHVGAGATVGSVIATKQAIVPAAVGVDIGCGMAALELDLTASELPDDLSGFMGPLATAVPAGVGVGHDTRASAHVSNWWLEHRDKFDSEIDSKLSARAVSQLGSLGSGNHFFELCLDERDHVWIVLHSGSRGLGNTIGQRYIKTAQELRRDVTLEDRDLAWLEDSENEFWNYVGDMLACQEYAAQNRSIMLRASLVEFRRWMGRHIDAVQTINCHHNFTQREEVPGVGLAWVTRKGAISAKAGELGIIPGSMGTRSYITTGLGNPESMCSCSHGAGRTRSRGAAKREFTVADLATAMQGKVWNVDRAAALIDEIPMAYKDIDAVMQAQADLVQPVHTLRQILNYKGA